MDASNGAKSTSFFWWGDRAVTFNPQPVMAEPTYYCSICLSDKQRDAFPSFDNKPNCAHEFCEPCLRDWIATQQNHDQTPTCPYCRVTLVKDKTPSRIASLLDEIAGNVLEEMLRVTLQETQKEGRTRITVKDVEKGLLSFVSKNNVKDLFRWSHKKIHK